MNFSSFNPLRAVDPFMEMVRAMVADPLTTNRYYDFEQNDNGDYEVNMRWARAVKTEEGTYQIFACDRHITSEYHPGSDEFYDAEMLFFKYDGESHLIESQKGRTEFTEDEVKILLHQITVAFEANEALERADDLAIDPRYSNVPIHDGGPVLKATSLIAA